MRKIRTKHEEDKVRNQETNDVDTSSRRRDYGRHKKNVSGNKQNREPPSKK